MLTTISESTARAGLELLSRLYREQLELGESQYLREHAHPATVLHHVNVFEWYVRHLKPHQSILDWGCNHGPDSCLLRNWFGESIELHACDFAAQSAFPVFRGSARAEYTQLTNPLNLPYSANRFDAIVASGVLEHTAMDGEALKELYRVLRPDGPLVITYLPHAYSWVEWSRRSRRKDYHRRLYTKRGLSSLLLSHGFEPLEVEFQGYLPNRLTTHKRPLWWRLLRPLFHPIVDALWKPVLQPLRRPFFTQTVLCAVARKMLCM
ncbi:MAG: class I SAM-dependent methyltransferase [Planctomycetia bacterium]|nr:class I SAM-dependent methyltransferase [Planctomycetia bacterium]